MKDKISVIGLGYIGLPTALLFARAGYKVWGFDIDSKKISSLKKEELYFDESGLEGLFEEAKNRFYPVNHLEESDVFIVAVPTPVRNRGVDLSYVLDALEKIRRVAKKGNLIILESTVGPRDCEDYIIPAINKWGNGIRFAHCTERAIPGNTINEMQVNDRVIGVNDQNDAEYVRDIYRCITKGSLYITDPTTAATCKVLENTFRSINIAFANELAKILPEIGVDAWEAITLSNKHPRVNIHLPGPGVGGHCIPVDPYFLLSKKNKFKLVELGLEINEAQPRFIVESVKKFCKLHNIKEPKIGILGYAYKKNVDDVRNSPAEKISNLLKKHYEVFITDEHVSQQKFLSKEDFLGKVDVVILVTDHDSYKNIQFANYPNVKFVYDTRNFFTQESIKNSSTRLYTLGGKNKV